MEDKEGKKIGQEWARGVGGLRESVNSEPREVSRRRQRVHAEGCRAIKYDEDGVMAIGSGEVCGICLRGFLGWKVDHSRLRTASFR